MVKKDKAKKAEKKARTAQKQEKKADKKDKKQKTRGGKQQEEDSDAEDVDLDAILAQYAKEQEQFLKVTEEISEPPSPRASATVLGSPSNDNELFIFGGEYFNGSLAHFYNDLFVYNTNRDDWKKVTSPNSPLPRSGHAWCRGGNAGGVYLFGGEFSSPKQGTFYHYNDFWTLDPGSREWSKLEGKGRASGPPARSGHRMTYFKNYIILFGGFQDTSQQTRYMNDLWIYDTSSYSWHEPKLPAGTRKPDARSSFSFLPHETGAVLYGGYSRVKATAGSGPKQVKGGSRPGAQRVVLKPVVHQDCWFLKITPPPSDAPSGTLPTVKWEVRKRPANAPNPARAGATMCSHKGRGIMFGGVHDVEESEEGIESEFFDTLFAWNVDRNRYFQLTLRRPKTGAKKLPERSRRDRGKQNEEELLRNLRALEMGDSIADDNHQALIKTSEETVEAEEKVVKAMTFEMPHSRFNAQLAVQGDILYIFGGTFEKGDQEFTMDEMYAIDLNKLDGVKEIYKRELQGWLAEEESDEDEDDADYSDDASENSGEESDGDHSTATVPMEASTAPSLVAADEDTVEAETSAMSDGLPYPRPFESLREFFERSKIQWQDIVIADMEKSGQTIRMTPKEISARGFQKAEEKWWDCREEIRALEDEQTEAGIGEVVNLAEKQAASAGVGRRR